MAMKWRDKVMKVSSTIEIIRNIKYWAILGKTHWKVRNYKHSYEYVLEVYCHRIRQKDNDQKFSMSVEKDFIKVKK